MPDAHVKHGYWHVVQVLVAVFRVKPAEQLEQTLLLEHFAQPGTPEHVIQVPAVLMVNPFSH